MTEGHRVELELLREGHVVRVIPMREGPLYLGRDLANSVVLLDEDVSSHHAVVSMAAEGLLVEDLRSTNGTFVNDEPVAVPTRLAHGDELRLGASALLRVRTVPESRPTSLVLVDLRAGIAHAIDRERFRIGRGEGCDLRLPDGPERAVTLLVHPDGEAWLGVGGEAVPLAPGDRFEAGGASFRLDVHEARSDATPVCRQPTRYPYGLVVGLAGAGGVLARVRHLERRRSHTVRAPNRASLLYLLARRLIEDRARGGRHEAGWCADEDVMIGIWGRARARQTTSHYSVLVHRLRKELEDAEFDPWFIEKRRGATRLCLDAVEMSRWDAPQQEA